jgi:hypothetical protein
MNSRMQEQCFIRNRKNSSLPVRHQPAFLQLVAARARRKIRILSPSISVRGFFLVDQNIVGAATPATDVAL